MAFTFGYSLKPINKGTPLSEYIDNGEISINKYEWYLLNKRYSNEEIIDFFIKEIIDIKSIDLPMKHISIKDAESAFRYALNYDCNPVFEGTTYTKFNYLYPLSNKYIEESNKANDASNYFQQYNRMLCEGIANPSPVRTWGNAKFLKTLFKALWSLKLEEVNTSVLMSIIALRKYTASQFNPLVAKSIYTKYNSKDVLDFSSGWGDRLCGFYASPKTETYIGIDPNTKVYKNYYKQADFYKTLTKEKKTVFFNSPAEEVSLDSEIVDTVFTSPPYFNTEKYTEEDTQSFKRYTTKRDWLEKFMFPTLDMCWRALKPNGYLIINISDSAQGGEQKNICDPMNDYIASLGGTFIEGLGMKMSKRPNSKYHRTEDNSLKEGTFIEPIWVWRK